MEKKVKDSKTKRGTIKAIYSVFSFGTDPYNFALIQADKEGCGGADGGYSSSSSSLLLITGEGGSGGLPNQLVESTPGIATATGLAKNNTTNAWINKSNGGIKNASIIPIGTNMANGSNIVGSVDQKQKFNLQLCVTDTF